MNIIAIILLLCMVGISTYIAKRFPESISEIAYIFPKWLFTILIMCLAMLVTPGILSVLSINYQWLGFLVIFGLWCVASSPYYKTEYIKLHYFGAILCFISAICIIILTKPLYLTIWLLYPLCLFKKTRRWWLMIAECLCFLMLMMII